MLFEGNKTYCLAYFILFNWFIKIFYYFFTLEERKNVLSSEPMSEDITLLAK